MRRYSSSSFQQQQNTQKRYKNNNNIYTGVYITIAKLTKEWRTLNKAYTIEWMNIQNKNVRVMPKNVSASQSEINLIS